MLKLVVKRPVLHAARNFSLSGKNNYKVALIGAGGGIGQPLSMLLKRNCLIKDLALYDICKAIGVGVDVSHIDTSCSVKGYEKPEDLKKVLDCSNIVIICAGKGRQPGMTRNDLFAINANIIKDLVCKIGDICPKALIGIITNPVNSLVPVAAEILKQKNKYDPNRLFGICTLDLVRARAFVGAHMDKDPKKLTVPVIGGHSGITIVPVLSCSEPQFKVDEDVMEKMVKRIQNAGTEILKAKAGGGTATLCMAHAADLFVASLLKALNGDKNVIEYAYVESTLTAAKFFSNALLLGKDGIKKTLRLPLMNPCERQKLDAAICQLQKEIDIGLNFVKNMK